MTVRTCVAYDGGGGLPPTKVGGHHRHIFERGRRTIGKEGSGGFSTVGGRGSEELCCNSCWRSVGRSLGRPLPPKTLSFRLFPGRRGGVGVSFPLRPSLQIWREVPQYCLRRTPPPSAFFHLSRLQRRARKKRMGKVESTSSHTHSPRGKRIILLKAVKVSRE